MRNISRLGLFVVASLASVSAQAVTFSDTFDVASPVVAVTSGSGYVSGSSISLGGGVERSLDTAVESNATPGRAGARSSVSAGAFRFETDAGVDGWSQISYRFAGDDYHDLTALRIDFLSSDAYGILALTIGDASTDLAMMPIAIAPSPIPFSITVPITEDDLSYLDRYRLTNFNLWIDVAEGGSLQIGRIESVPEPSSLAVVGLALFGVRARRRNR